MTTSAPETLPAEWYVSCDHFAREREAIFKRHWWMLARAEQLARPGDFVAGSVAGYPVFVIRGRDGGLLGFHNICRHRAGPVVHGGHGHCDVLRCRYHGWLYDLAGRLKKAPGITLGEDFEAADFSLFPIRVESWNGMVFACLAEEAPSLLEWLGDIPSIAEAFPRVKDMTFQGESLKEGACNWKAYGDNSCEGYHVGLVHGALGSAVDGEEVEIRPYEAGQFVGFDVTYRTDSKDQTRAGKGFWIYKFPGLLLHFAEYAFNAESVTPLSADRIELKRWFWSDEAASRGRGIDPGEAIEASEQVMDEDVGICEAVQRNLESGIYDTGRLSAVKEPGTVYFQELVRRAFA